MENHPLVFIKSYYKETNFVHLLLAVHITVLFALFACADFQLFLRAGILGFA